jgi:eukaryotic-like serine/threonine-protein kinase
MAASKQIEALLLESAAEIPDSGERRIYLDWACRGEPELRARLEKLLSFSKSAEKYFDFQPFGTAEDEEDETLPVDEEKAVEIGLKIGKYRLLRRLGEGGCGVVYLAEQEKPVKRQVALKLIRVGVKHDGMIARFEAERQALAMMDHPGIARVLDAGATATGRPYFVMQWVAGEKITDFCDHHRLSVSERLELFIKVCRAVQHAHQKGVIHRDLKPSNILVAEHDGVPMAKVIDFGIAMAAGGLVELQPGAMEQDYVIGTPSYMSPEQGERGGQDVDTRSDIFSLGVLLCEILTGETPFGQEQADRLKTVELRRNLSERRPAQPSSIIESFPRRRLRQIAASRSCPPHRLVRTINGDLDAIVMKCLRQNRTERYESASGLAAEIQRHLNCEPVIARNPSGPYLLAKLVRRNKLLFLAGAVVVATLAAGFGTSTWLFFRESEARREQVRLREISDIARAAESNLRVRAEAREVCAQASVEIYYENLEKADRLLASVPEELVPSSLEAADAYTKLADWHRLAGRWQEAAERYTAVVTSRSSVDSNDTVKVSYWLLPAVAAVCQVGDWERYEHLRQIAVERFATTSNPDVSRHLIRATLIRPASDLMMQAIAPLAVMEKQIPSANRPGYQIEASKKPGFDRLFQAWSYFSLELWYYRSGDFDHATQWGLESLKIEPNNSVITPTVRLVLAMAAQRSGRPAEARELLAMAATPIRKVLSGDMSKHVTEWASWMDWVLAGTLLNEAVELIGE